MPVAFSFSIVLWLGNSAHVQLSVAFIQVVKAVMPCMFYLVGVMFEIETFKVSYGEHGDTGHWNCHCELRRD